jgi:hypothetical protein
LRAALEAQQPTLQEWLENDAVRLEEEIGRQLGSSAQGILESLFPELREALRARDPDGRAVRCPVPRR